MLADFRVSTGIAVRKPFIGRPLSLILIASVMGNNLVRLRIVQTARVRQDMIDVNIPSEKLLLADRLLAVDAFALLPFPQQQP